VLRAICMVVGAVVLYCAVVAALWYALIGAGRRRGRRHAERRAAARAMPLAPVAGPDARTAAPAHPSQAEPERPAGSWDDLPPSLSRDRPWAVVVVLLGAPAVRTRAAPFVDLAHRSVDWPALLAESRSWPPDQRALVRGAYELSARVRRGRLEPEDGITTLS
jgi:hypothetical protein